MVSALRAKQFIGSFTVLVITYLMLNFYLSSEPSQVQEVEQVHYYRYDRYKQHIFIAAFQNFGARVTAKIIDLHPDSYCKFRPYNEVFGLLHLREKVWKNKAERRRLYEAGVSTPVLDSGSAAFILSLMAGNINVDKRFCCTDPFVLDYAPLIKEIFPYAKFLCVVMDGRSAVLHSLSRKEKVYNISAFNEGMRNWNISVSEMLYFCSQTNDCMAIKFEWLLETPSEAVMKISQFLNFAPPLLGPFLNNIVHNIARHGGKENLLFMGQDNWITVPYQDAFTTWKKLYTYEECLNISAHAPLLRALGYEECIMPPEEYMERLLAEEL